MPYLSGVGYADGEWMQTRVQAMHIKAIMNMHTWNECSADEARELGPGTDCVAGERGECECGGADNGARSGSWSDMRTSRVDCWNDGSQWSEDDIKAIMNMHTWN